MWGVGESGFSLREEICVCVHALTNTCNGEECMDFCEEALGVYILFLSFL